MTESAVAPLPRDRHAELAVVKHCVSAPDDLDAILGRLSSGDFFHEETRVVFAAIEKLHRAGNPISLPELKLATNGGSEALHALAAEFPENSYGAGFWQNAVESVWYSSHRRNRRQFVTRLEKHLDDGDEFRDALTKLREHEERGAVDDGSIKLEPASEFVSRVRDMPAVKMLVRELIPEDSTVLIHGQPRARKTYANLELAVSLAAGVDAFHLPRFSCPQPRTVFYLTEEDAEREIAKRVSGIARAHVLAAVPSNLLVSVRRGLDLDDDTHQTALISAAKDAGAAAIFIDPTRAITACVDGSPRDLKPFSDFLRRLRRETGATVVLSHHDVKPDRKNEDARDHAQRASGGGIFSISDAPISAIHLGNDKSLFVPNRFKLAPHDPEPFVVTVEDSGSYDDDTYELAVIGETKTEASAKGGELQERVLTFVRDNPCRTQTEITNGIGRRADDVRNALLDLTGSRQIGKTEKVGKGRGFHYRTPESPSCGECQ